MAKDKKSKGKEKPQKSDKKEKKLKKAKTAAPAKTPGGKSAASKAANSVKALSKNPLVADVVAAALVSMAAALRDTNKARQLADGAGDQLKALSGDAVKDGQIMWDLARDIGRKTLEAIVAEQKRGGKR
ncbi:MAG: hypothetical protein ABIQ32_01240 [Sphingomicrobium sp.]